MTTELLSILAHYGRGARLASAPSSTHKGTMTTERTPQHCGFLTELLNTLTAYGCATPRVRQLILDVDNVIAGQRAEQANLRRECDAASLQAIRAGEDLKDAQRHLSNVQRTSNEHGIENTQLRHQLCIVEDRIANLDSQLLDATKANRELTRQLTEARDKAEATQRRLAWRYDILGDDADTAKRATGCPLGPRTEFDNIQVSPEALTFREKGGVYSLQPVTDSELTRLGSAIWRALMERRTTHVPLYGTFRPAPVDPVNLCQPNMQRPRFNGPSSTGATRDEVDGGDGA